MSEFKPVLLTLPSLTPSLVLEVLPYGLTIHRIFVQADGRTHDLVIGPEAPEDHLSQKYINTIIGRYSNRIPVGTHQLERTGIKNEFTAIANESPRVSLHGGPTGFDSLPWEVLATGKSSLFTTAELLHLPSSPSASSFAIFRLVSPDGDQGFPGKLLVEALVALIGPGEQKRTYLKPGESVGSDVEYDLGSIVLVYRAKLEEGGMVTPLNLTQHWGFNLDASLKEGPESLSIKGHNLTIKADHIAKLDTDFLSTGFTPTSGDLAHSHNSKKIGEEFPQSGYDDYYLFSSPLNALAPTRIPLADFTSELDLLNDVLRPSNDKTKPPTGLRSEPVVELASDKSGLKLVFDTNQTGVMFYSYNFPSTAGARKKIHGGSGVAGQNDGYIPGSAAFLEFHEPLAAFLDPEKKDEDDTLLTSNELYHNYVRVDVRFKEPLSSEHHQ